MSNKLYVDIFQRDQLSSVIPDSYFVAAVEFSGKIFAAWRPAGDDPSHFEGVYGGNGVINWSTYDGKWNKYGIKTADSQFGPDMCVFKDQVYMVWRGNKSDDGLYYSRRSVGGDWSDEEKIPDVGTDYLASLAVFNDKLYAAWVGCGDDCRIWYSHFDGSKWSDQTRIHQPTSHPSYGESKYGPAIAVFNGKLYAAWRGKGSDEGIYFASFDGSGWTDAKKITGVGTQYGPRLVVHQNRLWAFWQGVSNENAWTSIQDGTKVVMDSFQDGLAEAWPLYDAIKEIADMLVAAEDQPLEDRNDTHIYYASFDGSDWNSQQTLAGAQTRGFPRPVVYKGQLYLIAQSGYIGVDHDKKLSSFGRLLTETDLATVKAAQIQAATAQAAANPPKSDAQQAVTKAAQLKALAEVGAGHLSSLTTLKK